MVNISRITTIFGNPYKGHMNVRVCVCACARVRACACACVFSDKLPQLNWTQRSVTFTLMAFMSWFYKLLKYTFYLLIHHLFKRNAILSLVVVCIHNGMSIQCWSFHHLICLFYETFWLCTWRLMETTRIIAISMAFKSANIGTKKQLWQCRWNIELYINEAISSSLTWACLIWFQMFGEHAHIATYRENDSIRRNYWTSSYSPQTRNLLH